MIMFAMIPVMIFLHMFADYHVQGILASMKQKSWWEKEGEMYKNDYKMALFCHAFEWTFIVLLPMLIQIFTRCEYWSGGDIARACLYIAMFLANCSFHYGVDDMKANEKSINLITDQVCHFGQVVITWLIWTIFIGWRY